jgi:hypothetical protein
MEPPLMLLRCLALVLAIGLAAPPAFAVIVQVRAGQNSVDGGVAVPTWDVVAGENMAVAALAGSAWQSGAGQTSGADGLPGTPFTFAGFTAPLGSLVGEIAGSYATLGANFTGTAWASGPLSLFHWGRTGAGVDGTIGFQIALESATPGVILPRETPIPAPGAAWILGLGALALGGLRRRRCAGATSSSA